MRRKDRKGPGMMTLSVAGDVDAFSSADDVSSGNDDEAACTVPPEKAHRYTRPTTRTANGRRGAFMAEYLFRTFETWVAHTNVRNHPQPTYGVEPMQT